MEFKDYYQVLGLDKSASEDEIKKSYRKLARKYHPDVSKEADAELHMKEVNEAYAVLGDLEKRAAYDQLGGRYRDGQEFQPPPNWDAGFEFSGADFAGADMGDFSDFFANLFGRAAAGQAGRGGHAGPRPRRGEDHHAKIVIDLRDAYQGAPRTITLRGARADAQGRVSMQEHNLTVQIPKGVKEGQHIRLAGQGSYTESFIGHWLARLLYWDLPWWVFVAAYTGFALLVALAWWWVRPGHARNNP